MPTKNTLKRAQIVTAGDMSGSVVSSVTNIQYMDNIGYQMNFTGTPTGVFSVEVSIDYDQSPPSETQTSSGNWVPITLPATPVASGAAGFIYLDLNELSSPWVRLRYTPTSGSGTLNAFVTGKSLS